MANAIELEILRDLNFLLAPILAIAKIATMVGLFLHRHLDDQHVHRHLGHGEGDEPDERDPQSAGRSAWPSSARPAGLMIAIPLVFTHVMFKARVAKFETELKGAAQRLLLLFQTLKPKQGDAAKAGATSRTAEPAHR